MCGSQLRMTIAFKSVLAALLWKKSEGMASCLKEKCLNSPGSAVASLQGMCRVIGQSYVHTALSGGVVGSHFNALSSWDVTLSF